MSLLTDIQMT